MLIFDLALHPSTEALLLSVTNVLEAFAYDGDDVFTLPSAVRALASGALLVNPGEAMLIADVGGLLQTIHDNPVLAALLDSWPCSTRCCDRAKGTLWQQQLSMGSSGRGCSSSSGGTTAGCGDLCNPTSSKAACGQAKFGMRCVKGGGKAQ
eukprot:gene2699-2999_t